MTDLVQRVGDLETDVKDIKTVLQETVVPLLSRLDDRVSGAATTSDMQALRDQIGQDQAGLRTEIAEDRTQATADAAALKASVAALPGRGFVIGTVIAIIGLCAGIVAATVAGLQYLQP